ncbi:MAG: hypothetical protein LBI53_07540 [Candidatus Peribacteria bacterium]|nr:hypothetical protein [Candidatus Peribacteria bacterium]
MNRNPGSGYSLTWSGANTGTYEMDTFFASLSDVANFKVNFTGNLSGIALSGLMKKEADFYRVVRVF